MRKPIGLGLAGVVATTSLAMAGGGGEDEKKKAEQARKNADAQMLEKLAAMPEKRDPDNPHSSATVASVPNDLSFLVGLRRLVVAADLSHVLQRRGLHLIVCGRGIEVEERSDVPAHGGLRACGCV